MRKNKGKSIGACLHNHTSYVQNPDKTEQGELVSSYQCSPLTVDEEFLLTKRLYEQTTGRSQKSDVIAYQVRQSFKPGEVTPEEANRIGYEFAERFLKGKHAFIVATHTDRAHIHNHIVFNSTALDGRKKFRNFWLSTFAVQRLSDLICLEHQLSTIEYKPYRERQKRIVYPPKESNRDRLCGIIDTILAEKPKDFEVFLQKLEQQGYEVKHGKYTSVKGKGRNALSGSAHWAQAMARTRSRRCWRARQNTTPIKSSHRRSNRSSFWWIFRRKWRQAKVSATKSGQPSST